VSFSQAYYTKNKKCAMQKHNASLLDILRGSIIIPGELLSSRAHFRLMNSEAKLNRNLYIYNLSKIREGYDTTYAFQVFLDSFFTYQYDKLRNPQAEVGDSTFTSINRYFEGNDFGDSLIFLKDSIFSAYIPLTAC
jgi:hypothetical protein